MHRYGTYEGDENLDRLVVGGFLNDCTHLDGIAGVFGGLLLMVMEMKEEEEEEEGMQEDEA